MKNKKLHIIFLDFDDIKNPLLAAGQAKATLEVGKRMAKMGHIVEIISSRYPGYKDRRENGMLYRHIGLGTKNIRVNNFAYIFALPFTARKLKGDVIVECFTAPISTLFSPLFTKIPVVALPTSFEAERFASLYHFPTHKIEKAGMKIYKYFLPYTIDNLKKMKKVNKDITAKIVPQGVGDEFFKIKKVKPEYILYLGRLDMGQKGIDLLLKAYKQVKDKVKFPLIIAGNGPDEEKIKKLIAQLSLEKSVKLIGPTYGERKAEILSKALFVAFPSRHEGFSLFSLEALASQNALVGFSIPGLAWTTEDIALRARPYNVTAYAKLLKEASEEQKAERMGKNARAFARKYTWDNVAHNFLSFFNEIVEKEKK